MSTENGPPQGPLHGETLIQGLSDAAEQALAHGDWESVDISVDAILEIDPDNIRALELREVKPTGPFW